MCCTIVKYKIGDGVMSIQLNALNANELHNSALQMADHALKADDLLPESLHQFLACSTPVAWLQWALENPETLLIDHAQCEKKPLQRQ
ncbi:hypothetical protein HSBAA_36100 [Vreelandella sulfidaeris]|uniref:Uncharacterized protein n=1 Tax=Vreelandella sulfidaeris TaxID=115553 RepID=A0A455UH74_9GAMM|nr:hypothetical protein HSBAA_36100 [Halomonas sulfidaeris]